MAGPAAQVKKLLLAMEGLQVAQSHDRIYGGVDEELLVRGDIHVGDGPGDLLGLDVTLEDPIVGVFRIKDRDRLLARTIVHITKLCESSAVNPRYIHLNRFIVLVWNQSLIYL